MLLVGPEIDVMSISDVERELGLSKDTLRMWERRYGFPVPLRDAKGKRTYPRNQVEQLRKIKRLVDNGFRPSKVIVNIPGVALTSSSAPTAKVPTSGSRLVQSTSLLAKGSAQGRD